MAGLTIVSDGQGHGGLTWCRGGIPLVYLQAGYLGTALWGCLFIAASKHRWACKGVLTLLGAGVVVTSLLLMPRTLLSGLGILQGLASIAWGVVIAFALLWCGLKLRPFLAQLALMFLGLVTALNAMTDVWVLIGASLGWSGLSASSDATAMQAMTLIPAAFWSVGWALASLLMLSLAVWWTYGTSAR